MLNIVKFLACLGASGSEEARQKCLFSFVVFLESVLLSAALALLYPSIQTIRDLRIKIRMPRIYKMLRI
jgi:hypothetical protein